MFTIERIYLPVRIIYVLEEPSSERPFFLLLIQTDNCTKMTSTDPWVQLEDKLTHFLEGKNYYEASQYVQTFIARKTKTLGANKCSTLVFLSIKKLVQFSASSEAGAVLVWYIEDGASADTKFQFANTQGGKGEDPNKLYCDGQRLLEILQSFGQDNDNLSVPFIDKIYGPLHICFSKSEGNKSLELVKRLYDLETTFSHLFQHAKKWSNAYKCVVRLNDDFSRVAYILDSWAKQSYKTEYPLFFARSVLQLLADKKVTQAKSLIQQSEKFVLDQPEVGEDVEIMSGPYAVWHVAIILTDLANLPVMARVDKTKLFSLLMQLYGRLVSQIDVKLVELLEKIGTGVFNVMTPNSRRDGMNSMSLFQNILANAQNPNSANQKGNGGSKELGFDINSVMELLKMAK